jgi:hypothetical protein
VYKQGGVVDPEEGCDIGTPDRANKGSKNDEMAAARVQYVYLVLTINVFLSLREGTSRLSGSIMKSSPKSR